MITIEEIEGDRWPEPECGSTFLVSRGHALRRKPLPEFTVEDLRIMLGQQIGVPVLLPLAVEILLRDPLAEGDYYPGDLLTAVLRLPHSAWSGLGWERQQLAEVLTALRASAESVDEELQDLISAFGGAGRQSGPSDPDAPTPCPACGSGPDQSTDPQHMFRSVCYSLSAQAWPLVKIAVLGQHVQVTGLNYGNRSKCGRIRVVVQRRLPGGHRRCA